MFRWGNSLCFLLLKRPLRSYPLPTCRSPCFKQMYSFPLTWVKCGWRYRVSKGVMFCPSPPPPPFLTKPPYRPSFKFLVYREAGRLVQSVSPLWARTRCLFMPHGLTPPPTPAEAVQLKPEVGTFNLTECSRHLNYLTVVLVQGGGHGGKGNWGVTKSPELYPWPGWVHFLSVVPNKDQWAQMVCYLCHWEVESNLFLLNRTVVIFPSWPLSLPTHIDSDIPFGGLGFCWAQLDQVWPECNLY